MALEFVPPPAWLIQSYLERKQPAEIANEGIGNALTTYAQMKQQQQAQQLASSKNVIDLIAQDPELLKTPLGQKLMAQSGGNLGNYQPPSISTATVPTPAANAVTPNEAAAQQSLPSEHPAVMNYGQPGVPLPGLQDINAVVASMQGRGKLGKATVADYKTSLETQKLQRDLAKEQNPMEAVITEEAALKAGQVPKGTHLVKPMTPLGTVTWDTATPEMRAAAKGIYEGRIRPQDMSFRDRGVIVQLAEDYANRNGLAPFKAYTGEVNATMSKFSTSGKMGQNILSLNTALGHASSALDSYQNIQNTNQKWLNVPINKLRAQTNDPHVIALGINLNALQGELANVFKQSGATDQEISHWRNYLNENLTPTQYVGALGKIDELLRSRLSAMEYQRAVAGGGTGQPLLSPHAQEISQRLAGGNISPTPPISTKAEYDALPSGSSYSWNGQIRRKK